MKLSTFIVIFSMVVISITSIVTINNAIKLCLDAGYYKSRITIDGSIYCSKLVNNTHIIIKVK